MQTYQPIQPSMQSLQVIETQPEKQIEVVEKPVYYEKEIVVDNT